MDENCKETDVLSVVHAGAVIAAEFKNTSVSFVRRPHVYFVYIDRGVEFGKRLKKELDKKLLALFPFMETEDIILVPTTTPEAWSLDPVWSQAPCTKHHVGENEKFPTHGGAAPRPGEPKACG